MTQLRWMVDDTGRAHMGPTFSRSFFDRLVRVDEGIPARPDRASLDEYLDALARDLEDLLGTVAAGVSHPLCGPECATSILAYGLPDRVYRTSDPRVIAGLVAATVRVFETRLRDVQVVPLGPTPDAPWSLVVEVHARLAEEPRWLVRFECRCGLQVQGVRILSSVAEHDAR